VNPTWPPSAIGDFLSLRLPDTAVDLSREYQFAGVYSFGRGVFRGQKRLGSGFAYRALTCLRRDQFVFPKLMAWEGAFGVVSEECEGCYVSPEFPVFDIDQTKVLPRFLHYAFKIPSVWKRVAGSSIGTNVRRRRLYPDQLLRQTMPLPPVEDQRTIVARVERLAAIIREAQRLRDEATEASEALIVSTHLALSGPSHEPLSEYLSLEEQETRIELNVPYPQVGVRSFGAGLFPKAPVLGGTTTYRSFNKLYSGALVLSQVKGWEGAVAVVPDELVGRYVSPEYRTFRCRDGRCLSEYLSILVPTRFFCSFLKDATRGVGARRERTRPEQFLAIKMPMPSLHDQQRALATLNRLRLVRSFQSETAVELDAMLPAVLDRIFEDHVEPRVAA
jgi:type I restriction enzyme, S subunit